MQHRASGHRAALPAGAPRAQQRWLASIVVSRVCPRKALSSGLDSTIGGAALLNLTRVRHGQGPVRCLAPASISMQSANAARMKRRPAAARVDLYGTRV